MKSEKCSGPTTASADLVTISSQRRFQLPESQVHRIVLQMLQWGGFMQHRVREADTRLVIHAVIICGVEYYDIKDLIHATVRALGGSPQVRSLTQQCVGAFRRQLGSDASISFTDWMADEANPLLSAFGQNVLHSYYVLHSAHVPTFAQFFRLWLAQHAGQTDDAADLPQLGTPQVTSPPTNTPELRTSPVVGQFASPTQATTSCSSVASPPRSSQSTSAAPRPASRKRPRQEKQECAMIEEGGNTHINLPLMFHRVFARGTDNPGGRMQTFCKWANRHANSAHVTTDIFGSHNFSRSHNHKITSMQVADLSLLQAYVERPRYKWGITWKEVEKYLNDTGVLY